MAIVIDGTGTISGVSATGITTAQTVSATNITTGTLPFAQLPAGSVLQVVSTTATTSFSTSSGTFTAIGLSAAITPKFTTSKIFVIANYIMNTQTSNLTCESTIYRNSTSLSPRGAHYAAAAGWLATTQSCSVLDSPATTSSVTYAVYARISAGAGTTSAGDPSTITLMEIAA